MSKNEWLSNHGNSESDSVSLSFYPLISLGFMFVLLQTFPFKMTNYWESVRDRVGMSD